MPRLLKITLLFLFGLGVAQAIATPMVYISDLTYLRTLKAIHAAGYLTIPNPNVFPELKSIQSAFFGGIFFTLTGGAFLTIIAMILAQLWGSLFSGKKTALILFCIPYVLSLILVNLKGWSPFVTLYVLIIPPVVFTATHFRLRPDVETHTLTKIISSVTSFCIIAIVLIFLKPADFNIERFVDFRDHFLLSNGLGKKINAFYYDNSLFSTQAFKSIGQQTLKTCKIININHRSLESQIAFRLINRDYLPLEGDFTPDLIVQRSENNLDFIHNGKVVLSSSANEFLRKPYTLLTQFEKKTDRFAAFRGFIMISLLVVLAVMVYFPVFSFFHFILNRFLSPLPAITVTGMICTAAGLMVIFSMHASRKADYDDTGILASAIQSDQLTTRLSALKYIQKNGIEISQFPEYRRLAESPHIPERYWLAKALGQSRTQDTHGILLKLLDDDHFNVICMALSSLGHRKIRSDILPILNRIKTSRNWYIQWYGYKALRSLGWTQKKSV